MDVGRDDFSVEPSKRRGCTSKFGACRAAIGSCVTVAKSVTNSSALSEAYDDLVHPWAESLGNTRLVPGVIGMRLCG